MQAALLPVEPPEPTRLGEVTWLEPYRDALLDDVPELKPGPEGRYETREAISLAFVTALQLLPPRRWMGHTVRLHPAPGGEFFVEMSDGFAAQGAFIALDPGRRVGFSWG